MIHLKKITYAISIFSLVFLISSCEKWLDVSPKSQVKYSDLFSNKNGFKDQLTGVYTSLAQEKLYGANLTYGMMDVLGQQYIWTQEMGRYYYLHRFEYQNAQSLGIINDVWSGLYSSIANVNILLDGIKDYPDVLSDKEKNIYEGEALGLRAFLHFDLLRLFGESYVSGSDKKSIPYVSSISKNVPPLSSISEVLDLIISDLIKAESLLADDPIKTGESTTAFLGNRKFHFNYYAVKAMLARAYLYKNNKANAFKYAKEVIDANKFTWVSRESVTTPNRESRDGFFSKECIFLLNNLKLDKLTGIYLREGMGDDQGNLLKSDPDIIRQIFETNQYGGFDWRYSYYFETQAGRFIGSSKLWQFYNMPVDYSNRQPLIRQSEMYLIAAESAAEKNTRINYFNELRRHRGFEKEHDLDINVVDDMLQNEIAKEYRKEFIGEGQWFFYCKRMNLAELPNVTVPFNRSLYTLPLPDQEIEYGNR